MMQGEMDYYYILYGYLMACACIPVINTKLLHQCHSLQHRSMDFCSYKVICYKYENITSPYSRQQCPVNLRTLTHKLLEQITQIQLEMQLLLQEWYLLSLKMAHSRC